MEIKINGTDVVSDIEYWEISKASEGNLSTMILKAEFSSNLFDLVDTDTTENILFVEDDENKSVKFDIDNIKFIGLKSKEGSMQQQFVAHGVLEK
jgi:hypothetical protein